MNAAVVRSFDAPPRYDSFDLPASAEGLAVEVLASALHPRVRSGASGAHYTSRGVLPLVPGIDGVGRTPDGQRVYFLAAHDTLGTMAEQTLADPAHLVPVPGQVSSAAVAAAMIPAISSWVALTQRVTLRPGQRVLILGATGTAGQLAIQIAKHLGAAEVVAAGRGPALERAPSLGAGATVRLTGGADDGEAVAAAASEVDVVLDYLWGSVTSVVMPALCRRRRAETDPLHWIQIGSAAGDELPLSSVLLRKRNLHILGSGQGATSTGDMLKCVPGIVAALAEGKLEVRVREAALADVERVWGEKTESGERIVFVP